MVSYFQVGFDPLKVLRKRNKALRKIRKQLREGELLITDVCIFSEYSEHTQTLV